MNKRELKDMIDQQHESINNLISEKNKLVEQVTALKAEVSQYREWYKDESARLQFYKNKLRRLRYIMALDTVENGTHRSRNELYRRLVNDIAYWLSAEITAETRIDMDDIPF